MARLANPTSANISFFITRPPRASTGRYQIGAGLSATLELNAGFKGLTAHGNPPTHAKTAGP